MTRAPLPDDPRSGGFVLVGVVMFVLALTILGLSVFSLSSYEAQFLRTSRDEVQAFNDAMGGMERAVYAIAATDSLEKSALFLPPGVDSCRAWVRTAGGGQRSTGSVGPNDTVWVKVAARRGDTQRTVIAGYKGESNDNFYTRTLHSASYVAVDIGPGGTNRNTVQLGNAVRQTVNDSAWLSALASPIPPDWGTMNVPVPDVPSFIASRWSSAVQAGYDTLSMTYSLHNPSHSNVKYFKWPDVGGWPNPPTLWTRLDQTVAPRIDVDNMVVWLIPHGIRFEYEVRVHGHNDDCLVIVAGAGLRPDENFIALGYTVGVEFMGGLESDIPVIVVTDGTVSFDRTQNANGESEVDYFSAFARGVSLKGPLLVSGRRQELRHDANATEDRPGGLISRLLSQGALPNALGVSVSRFEMLAGTWQDVTP